MWLSFQAGAFEQTCVTCLLGKAREQKAVLCSSWRAAACLPPSLPLLIRQAAGEGVLKPVLLPQDSCSSPRRQRLSWQRSFLGSRRVPRASEVCASCPDLPRALPQGRRLAEIIIPFLRAGTKIWKSLKVRICKERELKYVLYPTSEAFYPGQSVGSLGFPELRARRTAQRCGAQDCAGR